MNKPLIVVTLAAGLGMALHSTQAAAHDPVGGAILGTAIGAAAGGPVGAAIGAVLGTAIASDHHDYDRHRGYRERHWDGYREPAYYDRGRYERAPVYREPARYYERYDGPRYYEARNYREPPRYYSEPRRYYREPPRYYEEPRYIYR